MQNTRTKTLFQYVIPAILTNAFIFILTIFDGVFVGHGVDTNALGAVNIAMPFVMVVTAINMMTAIGGGTIVAIREGRKDFKGANDAFMHALVLNVAFNIIVTIAGVFFTEPLCRMLGADGVYLSHTMDYVFWWAILAIPSGLSAVLQAFCRNDGSPMLSMVSSVATFVVDIPLNAVMIFGLKMGVMGAALSTGIAQTAGMMIALFHFLLKKGNLRMGAFKPERKLFGKVLFRGVPEMIAQFATPVTTICLNHVLYATLADEGVNTFAVISYVASFAMSVLYGTAEGLQPLFGEAYGEKNDKDMKFYFRSGVIISLIGSAICVAISILLSNPISRLFGAEGAILDATAKYMPQYVWAFIVAGLNTLISAYFYSTKRSVHAIILNVARSFVINIAVILGLSALSSGIVWYTFGISEVIVLVIAFILFRASERKGIQYK